MWCTNRLLWHTNSDFYGIRTPTFTPYDKSWFSGRGEDNNFSLFRVRRFTEWPGPLHWIAFPVKILPNPPFTELPPPCSLKTPFFHWKVLRRIPSPKIGSDMSRFYWGWGWSSIYWYSARFRILESCWRLDVRGLQADCSSEAALAANLVPLASEC